MAKQPDPKLVELYKQIAEHTFSDCKCVCADLGNCCEEMYCDLAKKWAKKRYNVDLAVTGHPSIPFMGEKGCTVAPHFRPLCALHHCQINSLGFKHGDQEWTKKYYELREAIELLEGECEEMITL